MSNSSRDCLVPVKWSALVVLLAAVVVTGTPAEAAGFSFAWGSSGAGDGQFSGPGGTEIDASGTVVYVVDTGNNRVQKFAFKGLRNMP
jgi:DNA-binding beta-propeller fold protein YncE